MTAFTAHDGTELAYHVYGDGAPVVCRPGGPMQDSVYLGDLGGLPAQRKLVVMALRGTGQSAMPEKSRTDDAIKRPLRRRPPPAPRPRSRGRR